ncbi:MAG TPA: 7-carboxy-7-deazaguanine synthase QueE [Acidimicrobiales bacterium]|nr:7-carboxy-7-deazaguanine synthase QueE [Acidimicrobiales bacterium]
MSARPGDAGAGTILVSEAFSAIQGEGAHVGRRQVFLRLSGCNIRCGYCDQPEALELRPGPCRFEQTPGRRDWRVVPSPLAVNDAVAAVDRLWRAGPHHSVSVTGGEPLAQSGRLAELLPLMKGRGHRVHLETNGTLVAGLRRVAPWVDEVSMDLKLGSVDGQGVAPSTQRRFLEVAIDACPVAVKVVLGPETDPGELDAAMAMVAETAPAAPVFLQPVTPFAAVTRAPTPDEVLSWQELALARHGDVRVVPQTHKMIGQL